MRLFLKSNRVIETNDKNTVILAYLREDIAGIRSRLHSVTRARQQMLNGRLKHSSKKRNP